MSHDTVATLFDIDRLCAEAGHHAVQAAAAHEAGRWMDYHSHRAAVADHLARALARLNVTTCPTTAADVSPHFQLACDLTSTRWPACAT